ARGACMEVLRPQNTVQAAATAVVPAARRDSVAELLLETLPDRSRRPAWQPPSGANQKPRPVPRRRQGADGCAPTPEKGLAGRSAGPPPPGGPPARQGFGCRADMGLSIVMIAKCCRPPYSSRFRLLAPFPVCQIHDARRPEPAPSSTGRDPTHPL